MRGLPFPSNALFDPEATSDGGTPSSNVVDIPIDPALAGTPAPVPPPPHGPDSHICDPSQFQPGAFQVSSVHPSPDHFSNEPLQYHQGPRGDPFAPQAPAAYLSVQELVPLASKPPRRRRRPRREDECGFCQGHDSKNKRGEPEVMVSCQVCGRSGHPSCMELDRVADVVRSYPWTCIECKICEICQQKGDDERILFCDFCDRGWHMDCLRPPLDKAPPGQWHCPLCPPLELVQPPPDPTSGSTEPDDTLPSVEPETDGADEDESESDSSSSDSSLDPVSTSAPTPRPPQPVKSKKKRRPKRKSEPQTPRPTKRMRLTVRSPVPPLVVRLRIPAKGKGKEREDDTEKNAFEDLLTPAERDLTRTTIDTGDRGRFDRSRLAADEKLAPPPPSSTTDLAETPVAGPSSRPLRSHPLHPLSIPPSLPTPSPVPSTPTLHPATPTYLPSSPDTPADSARQPQTLRIRTIRFGRYDIRPWYDAPFPEEYANIPDGRLWICEFCLKYMRSAFAFGRHRMKCKARHPPGDEIYRDGLVSIFEVDGRKNKIYCQNLCLLSKMFLDHKSLFYDVEPFLFYVMSEFDEMGAHFVGYFSKEKCSPKDYNVSCIMTLPVRQRQGWGSLLIDFSYLLSKKEQRTGSPEKPLSALGALGYKNYWTLALMRYLKTCPPRPTLEDICQATSMTPEDVHGVLVHQNMISKQVASPTPVRPSPGQSIKFPRGRKNGVPRRHPQRTNTHKDDEGGSKSGSFFVPPMHYEISWDPHKVDEWLDNWDRKGYLKIKPEKLKWTPFLLARTRSTGEVFQSRTGTEVDASDGTPSTPVMLLENGALTGMDGSDRERSSTSGIGKTASETETAKSDGLVNPSETPASRLFDDELSLDDAAATPKKQLRSRSAILRYAMSSSQRTEDLLGQVSPRHTRSATRPMMMVKDGLHGWETEDVSFDGCHHEDDGAAVMTKRWRDPLTRKPSSTPPEVSHMDHGMESGLKVPTSPRKRRKGDTPRSVTAKDAVGDERWDDVLVHSTPHGRTNGIHHHHHHHHPTEHVVGKSVGRQQQQQQQQQVNGIAALTVVVPASQPVGSTNGLKRSDAVSEDKIDGVLTECSGVVPRDDDTVIGLGGDAATANGVEMRVERTTTTRQPVMLTHHHRHHHPLKQTLVFTAGGGGGGGRDLVDIHDSDLDAEGDTDDEM